MFQIHWTRRHTTLLIYTCVTILIAVLTLLIIIFPGRVTGFIGGLLSAISPVFIGFATAYLLYPICMFFDRKVLKFMDKNNPRPRLRRIFALALTILLVATVLTLFILMIAPQIKSSYIDLEAKFDDYLATASQWLDNVFADFFAGKEDMENPLDALLSVDAIFEQLGKLIDSSFDLIGNFMNTAVAYSSKFFTTISKVVVSVLFAAYFLIEKEMLFEKINAFTYKFFSEKSNRFMRKWVSFTHRSFGGFISGKILDAIIITLLNFIVFGLCRIPYYPLIALITGITDIIPYFGPFIGAIPCAFIILIADPIKVIWFVVLTLVIQQLDGNIIGPKILGEKVGVDSLLIIVAITVTGGLWGLFGMFVGVPIFAVFYQIIKEFIEYLLIKKRKPRETAAYYTEEASK